MDVVLTLSSEQIQLIKEGKKTMEVRKTDPLFFNPQQDKIYLCEKETGEVVGYMVVNLTIRTKNKYAVLTDWSKDICVPIKELENYVRNAKYLYVYVIDYYHEFAEPLSLKQHLKVSRVPPTFAYTPGYKE